MAMFVQGPSKGHAAGHFQPHILQHTGKGRFFLLLFQEFQGIH